MQKLLILSLKKKLNKTNILNIIPKLLIIYCSVIFKQDINLNDLRLEIIEEIANQIV